MDPPNWIYESHFRAFIFAARTLSFLAEQELELLTKEPNKKETGSFATRGLSWLLGASFFVLVSHSSKAYQSRTGASK